MTLFWFLWVLALAAGLVLGAPATWRDGFDRFMRRPVRVPVVKPADRRRTARLLSRAGPRLKWRWRPEPCSKVSMSWFKRFRLLISDVLGLLKPR
jgi:hypothetical protein